MFRSCLGYQAIAAPSTTGKASARQQRGNTMARLHRESQWLTSPAKMKWRDTGAAKIGNSVLSSQQLWYYYSVAHHSFVYASLWVTSSVSLFAKITNALHGID